MSLQADGDCIAYILLATTTSWRLSEQCTEDVFFSCDQLFDQQAPSVHRIKIHLRKSLMLSAVLEIITTM